MFVVVVLSDIFFRDETNINIHVPSIEYRVSLRQKPFFSCAVSVFDASITSCYFSAFLYRTEEQKCRHCL